MRGWLAGVVLLGAMVLLGAVVVAVVALTRPAPPVELVAAKLPRGFPGRLALAWPSGGQAAVGVQGLGLVSSPGTERPAPIASLAKIMTAYVVLRDHPLPADAVGPSIAVTPADVALYRVDRSLGQSVARVKAGERLTERQALEALMLPSANNIASFLAVWDAGSQEAFVAKMNAQAKALRLAGTRYVDASGFDPATTSTAADQVHLAMVAMRLPAFAQIVALSQATLPVAGTQRNLDGLLGGHGVVGVKTGSTSAAGACFVFASRQRVAGRSVLVVGAVLGQPLTPAGPSPLDAAFDATTALLDRIPHVLTGWGFLEQRRPLAILRSSWTAPVPVRPQSAQVLLGWPGLRVRVRILARRRLSAPVRAGQQVGSAVARAGGQRVRLRLVAARAVPAPSFGWRLAHP